MLLIETTTLIRSLFLAAVLNISAIFSPGSGCADLNVVYAPKSECIGKTSTQFVLASLEKATRAECAMKCDVTFQCVLFFYNPATKYCSLHRLPLEFLQLYLDNAADSSCYIPNDISESWIVEISSPDTFANMFGKSDGQYQGFWVGEESIFEISHEMYIEEIHIYQKDQSRAALQISVLTPDGTWYPVYHSQRNVALTGAWTGHLFLNVSHFKTANVRIRMSDSTYPNYIDAMKVVGKTQRLNQRIPVG